MAKLFKVCCGVREANGEYGYLIKQVRGERYYNDENLFIYTKGGYYHLVDIDTGLELNHFNYHDQIDTWYNENKKKYYAYRDSVSYKEKVKRFKALEEAK